MLSNAPLLTNSVTPTDCVVLPLVDVLEVNAMLPVQLPGLSPVGTTLTVSVAGVVFDDKVACSHPAGQFPVGAVVMLKEIGKGMPPLAICAVCGGGAV
jgi:hypothetical protein